MSRTLPFLKMHGAGNDFIMIDGRQLSPMGLDGGLIAKLCQRRLGIGADGMMIIYPDAETDFTMTYFNADGGEAEMCGNGARCAVAFAQHLGLVGQICQFRTSGGVLQGHQVVDEIKVSLPTWYDLQSDMAISGSPFNTHHLVNTGVPHLVVPVPDVSKVDLAHWGPILRHHAALGPAGANVDWVQETPTDGTFPVRTYERGVEAETLACGTGAAAVAVVLCKLELAYSPVQLLTRGGHTLEVTVDQDPQNPVLWLQGPVEFSFQGEVTIDD